MKTALKVLGGLVVLVLLAGGGVFLYAKSKLADTLGRTPEVHAVDFPVPFPLTEQELAELRAERAADPTAQPAAEAEGDADEDGAAPPPDPLAGVDLGALALDRARARGKHLVEARYACIECHGDDFGGGVMVDSAALGRFLGPNLTLGEGGKTAGYTAADWDRIVRHGVRRDGHPGIMPAEDFQRMTDRELSDIIAYIRSAPPVDSAVPAVSYGPVGTMLVAFGAMPLAVDKVPDHQAAHAKLPPPAEPDVTFGRHVAGVCTGCHREGLEGGPILSGDPDWPPAMNLTPHAEGLAGWTFEQFDAALRTGKRPDGSQLRKPMSQMTPYCARMTDTEMRALWAFVQNVDPKPTPKP